MARKRIITAAVTGAIHNPTLSEYLPITPEEIVEDAVKAYEAGAAVAHIHVRVPEDGRPVTDMDLFKQVTSEIKKRCNLVLCVTSGGSPTMTHEERIRPVPILQPELASNNAGSMNFALFQLLNKVKDWKHQWEKDWYASTEDLIFPNTFKSLKYFVETMYKYDTKPEFEVYDVGMINNLAYLIDVGVIKKPIYLQFVMGILGGIPATVQNLLFLVETAKKQIGDFEWSLAAAGKDQLPLTTVALTMGGHVRVGLEDSIWLRKGVLAKSSAEQVAVIKRIANDLSIETATPDEAREILGLKGLDKVNF